MTEHQDGCTIHEKCSSCGKFYTGPLGATLCFDCWNKKTLGGKVSIGCEVPWSFKHAVLSETMDKCPDCGVPLE